MTASQINPVAVSFWREVKFPIGESDTAGLGDVVFPQGNHNIPPTGEYWLDHWLGNELGQTLFKLLRPWPIEPGETREPDEYPHYLQVVLCEWVGSSTEKRGLRDGLLHAMGCLADHALSVPSRMPTVRRRIDSLSNQLLRVRVAALLDRYSPDDPCAVFIPTVFCEGFEAFNATLLSDAQSKE